MPNRKKTTTSSEVKNNWKKRNYKTYQLNLRLDEDADLIALIETKKQTDGTETSETIKNLLRN